LEQQQDDAEILSFKVDNVSVRLFSVFADISAQALLTDIFGPAKVGRLQQGDAHAPPLRLPDSVARSIEQMCLQT
jgi:hypothetical protein